MSNDFTSTEVASLAQAARFGIVDSTELPARQPKLAPIPQCLCKEVTQYLARKYPNGLYSHQAAAIEQCLGQRQDVCITTATASGKTDVFIAAAADTILRDRGARILALYPARALIQDQLTKWSGLDELGLKACYIDGGVDMNLRPGLVEDHRIVLMTPDVAHAWMLNKVGDPTIKRFLANLNLLILDEAHVYDGVFGTNMAYFLRRLETATTSAYRVIVTTATLGEPEEFMSKLTGRVAQCLTDADDGSAVPKKTLLLAQGGGFSETVELLKSLVARGKSPFLAFADSRKQVERLVAAIRRQDDLTKSKGEVAGDDLPSVEPEEKESDPRSDLVLPYRAGYEDVDRKQIQRSLAQGQLAGVVSTSALELGIDIGDISLVILLSTPPSSKAFLQRIGRGGRKRPGTCLILDTARTISMKGLRSYLNRPVEPNWLYLDNPYLQYTNALCSAHELRQTGLESRAGAVFETLPDAFRELLNNELVPVHPVPDELFHLKQRAQAGPHYEFPLRSGIEKQFNVEGQGFMSDKLGTLTYSQMLREAYPGAIYYYMARPYRVQQFKYNEGKILARGARYWTTEPISQTMVFPDIPGGLLALWTTQNGRGFVAESRMQVSDRVTGFREKHGGGKPEQHIYGPGSPYYQHPLTNLFQTTGVCWFFPDCGACDEGTALQLREAFCSEFGIVERDVGVGLFTCKTSPGQSNESTGYCLYDVAAGSLRLTQVFGMHFERVVAIAEGLAQALADTPPLIRANLASIASSANGLVRQPLDAKHVPEPTLGEVSQDGGYEAVVVEPGQKVLARVTPPREVTVLGHRYTPAGLWYDLEDPNLDRWGVPAHNLQPIYGQTRMIRVNLMTGDVSPYGYYDGTHGVVCGS